MNIVHEYSVMEMMIQSRKTYTREMLVKDIHDTFGTSAKFFTCSADDMTADELINFLDSSGRLLKTNGKLSMNASMMCYH